MSPQEKAARKAWCWSIAKANLSEAAMILRWMKRCEGRLDALETEVYGDKVLRRLGMANDYRALAKSGYESLMIHPPLSF